MTGLRTRHGVMYLTLRVSLHFMSHSPIGDYSQPGADSGFWFGRDTGTRSGGRKSSSGVQGQRPGGDLGQSPQKPEECYAMTLKITYGEKKQTTPNKLTLYDNIIIIIISSTHRFTFPAIFVLKYKTQSASSRASEMVHNGSRFWNVVAMD